MSLSKLFVASTLGLFALIGVIAIIKRQVSKDETPPAPKVQVVENKTPAPKPVKKNPPKVEKPACKSPIGEVDRIEELFQTGSKKNSFLVETITYKSRVPWIEGRSAWIADYAAHFSTSRHFIARSLNRKVDYFTQKVADGDTFNVLRKDIEFYCVIDLSCCKLFLYGYNSVKGERILLKTYSVCAGRQDNHSLSGSLTPLGKYQLGSKVALYKPGAKGLFHGESVEMVQIFGTRWLPFGKEVGECTAPAKGYGLHGAPWVDGVENLDSLGKYESDGCVRLAMKDIEELFAIVITRPTTIDIVKNFSEATLPGKEVP